MIGLLLTRWRTGLSIAAALAFLGLALAANHYRHAYHAEKALRRADRAAYAAAQSEATVIAKRALDAAEARYRSKANEADKSYLAQLADARSAADRYIAAHRVRWQAFARDASAAVAAPDGGRAGSPDGPGAAANMVAVIPADIQVCTENTLRLEAARAWALGL
ncbi:MAG: hypothetical protein EBR45_01490 [Betaproteobacteria bacterium]|nr:hypothetical protein [Betaproteobacteria bacterium]